MPVASPGRYVICNALIISVTLFMPSSKLLSVARISTFGEATRQVFSEKLRVPSLLLRTIKTRNK